MLRRASMVWLSCILAMGAWLACVGAKAEPPREKPPEQIHAVAENDIVLHYATPDGEVAGPGARLVREVLRRAGMPYDLKIYPWSRAYLMAQSQPNVLIFSMARTREREDKFKWVGEVIPVEFRLIKLKSRTDINIKTLDDARKYSIGVINQDVAHRFFVKKEFQPDKLDLAPNSDLNLEKLLLGRTDMIVASASNPNSICLHKPIACDKIDTAFKIEEMKTSLYMAFSQETPDSIVSRVRNAYDAVRADGTWARIMKNGN